jgi:divalent metal cation (Fe/Co/Zn/Cd) transporter
MQPVASRVAWASIAVNVALSLLNLAIAAASDSLAVAAEVVHNLVDLVTSVAVLAGVKISQRKRLDASLDAGMLAQVRAIREAEPAVTEARSLAGRNAGRYRFLEADVALRVADLEKAHLISQRLETAVRAQVPRVEQVRIHYEPKLRTHLRCAPPWPTAKVR